MSVATPGRPIAAALLAALTMALLGCGSSATPSIPASPAGSAVASASPGTSPSATPSGDVDPTTAPSPSIGQTDTEWGRIWDTVPASFPVYAGGESVEPDEAASLAYDVAAAVETVTTDLQAELETAGFSTYALSGPFENGSTVIDSMGDAPGCEVRTTIAPLGATTRVTVLYGVGCPPG